MRTAVSWRARRPEAVTAAVRRTRLEKSLRGDALTAPDGYGQAA
ncbi:hypothetical protein ACFRCI_48635 [Streptomyces sp. NPDC056638]